MATIKDIARAAGVSHATVSNVLNHKGNVSAQKVKLVMDTAAAMGYHVNEAASALRSGSAQTLAVILPDTGSADCDDLYRSLCQAAAENGYSMLLRLTNNVPGTELKAIQDVLASRAKCAVVVTSLTDPAHHYDVLRRSGTEVVFALRGPHEGYLYAGFDLAAAAQALARRVYDDGARHVCLMTGMACYPSQAAFRKNFQSTVGTDCRVTCVESITAQSAKQAFSLFEGDGPDAVVVTGSEMAVCVLEAGRVLGKHPKVYSLAPQRVLHPSGYIPFELDFRRLGLELGRMLTDTTMPRTDLSGLMPGFTPSFHRAPAAQRHTLRLLTADTPVTRALERLLPRLELDTGLSLSITALPTQEANLMFSRPDQMKGYDLARMDLALIDRWAAEFFTPLSQLSVSTQEIMDRLLPGLAQEYSLVGDKYYGLPLDPGCHLLFYREDLFCDPHIRRRYYELYRQPLSVPTDYDSFLRIAQFFNRIDLKEYGVDHSLLLTRRSSECLSSLASLTENGRLSELTADVLDRYVQRQRSLEDCADFVEMSSWNRAVSRFARGQCALLIAYSNYTRYLADEPLCAVSGQVGYAPSPSGKAFRGGGMIGVMKNSPHIEECALFLDWLYSPGISQLLALLSGCSPLSSAYDCAEITDLYPWLDTVKAGLLGGARRQLIPTLQAPLDRMHVEEEIAVICNRAVRGERTVQETLDDIFRLGF